MACSTRSKKSSTRRGRSVSRRSRATSESRSGTSRSHSRSVVRPALKVRKARSTSRKVKSSKSVTFHPSTLPNTSREKKLKRTPTPPPRKVRSSSLPNVVADKNGRLHNRDTGRFVKTTAKKAKKN